MGAARSLLCVAIGLLGAGCFLEELKVRCIDSRTDCRALNVANKIDEDACEVYQCRDDGRGCEKRERDYDDDGYLDPQACRDRDPKRLDCNDDPDGGADVNPDAEERCDDVDNNCNGWIDEGVLADDLRLKTATYADVTGASYTAPGGVLSAALHRGGSTPTTALWHTHGKDEDSQLLPTDNSCGAGGSCAFRELAVAANSEVLLALGVDVSGCLDGVLRVGARASAANHVLNWRGSTDVQPVGSLPDGIERALSCGAHGRGARAPSLAQAPTGGDASALGLFRAGSATRPNAAAPLAAIRLRVKSEGPIELLGGRSEPVDDEGSLGLDAASIASWNGSDPGYFVGYDSEEGVELAFAPRDWRAALAPQHTRVFVERGVRAVVVTVHAEGNSSSPPLGLAAAWRQTGASSNIRFLRLTYDTRRSPPFTALGPALDVATARNVTEGPVMAYVATGFRADVSIAGGWFISWVEGSGLQRRIVGVRVAEASGAADPEELVLAEVPDVTNLFVYPLGDDPRFELGYAFLSSASARQLNIGSLSCASRE